MNMMDKFKSLLIGGLTILTFETCYVELYYLIKLDNIDKHISEISAHTIGMCNSADEWPVAT